MTKAKPSRLIFLCWLAYSCAYVGKLSYSANISRIGSAFGVTYAEAGMVTTFFFFVYGAGQIVNGLLCKKYNIKYVVFSALAISSLMNILVAITPYFTLIKYLWLINGAATSFLWTSLIRLLSETLPREDIPKATVAMGTTVATGTCTVYGASSLFATILSYHATFILAATVLSAVCMIWLLSFDRITKPLAKEREEEALSSAPSTVIAPEKRSSGGSIIPFVAVIAMFAIANNFVKDGLTSWTPDILSSLYNTPDWLSILLALLLPMMAILGSFVAVRLQKSTGSFILTLIILFAVSSVLIGTVIGFISTGILPLTISCFALVSCLMAGVNNVITSMIPLHMKEKINSGKLAGILNAFCYLGSTVSSYGLGLVADALGWHAVFRFLLAAGIVSVMIGCIYFIASSINQRSKITK